MKVEFNAGRRSVVVHLNQAEYDRLVAEERAWQEKRYDLQGAEYAEEIFRNTYPIEIIKRVGGLGIDTVVIHYPDDSVIIRERKRF